jgi:hypothetical protein
MRSEIGREGVDGYNKLGRGRICAPRGGIQ